MDETVLLAFMFVLVAFIVVLVILGVVLIVFLRVIISSLSQIPAQAPDEKPQETTAEPALEQESEQQIADEPVAEDNTETTEVAATQDEPTEDPVPDVVPTVAPEETDEDENAFITEKNERVRYDRSCAAKLCQLKNQTKEWYSELKNELLSYEKVKARLSWRYETYRIGRTTLARFMVRGKTLCLLLAVNPANYADTKYTVEDVSNTASTADTPTLYRIKSAKRAKYAKELIMDVMRENRASVNLRYIAKDYFMPYAGDMALMKRGLVKRVVNNSTRKYKIEEIGDQENA